MLKKCSSVLVLSEDDVAAKRIFSVCSEEDIDFEMSKTFESVKNPFKFGTIIAEIPFLRFLKEHKEKVVVLRPGEYLLKLIEADYQRFLFDVTNKQEVYVATLVPDFVTEPTVSIGDVVCDFNNNKFKRDGKELYITKGEAVAIKRTFVEKVRPVSGKDRAYFYRMRQRFGKNFLTFKE